MNSEDFVCEHRCPVRSIPSSRISCWDTKCTISQEKILDIVYKMEGWGKSKEWLRRSFRLFGVEREAAQTLGISTKAAEIWREVQRKQERTLGRWDSQGHLVNSQMCQMRHVHIVSECEYNRALRWGTERTAANFISDCELIWGNKRNSTKNTSMIIHKGGKGI